MLTVVSGKTCTMGSIMGGCCTSNFNGMTSTLSFLSRRGLKAEIAGSQEKLDHSAGFGLNELITSGIVDYNVKRTLETNAPISNAAKDGLKTYIENNSELSRDQKNIYEAIVDHAATKELVSDYSFSVAGVYQGSETYANSPLLSVGNITPQLSLKINEAVLGNKELIAECEVIKQAPKTLGDTQVQLKETGKELEQKKAALEEAKKTNNSTEITKLADAIDTLVKRSKTDMGCVEFGVFTLSYSASSA